MTFLEEWRPVVGHPGYEISSIGRCRSLDKVVPQHRVSRHGTPFVLNRPYKGRLLSPYIERYVSFPLGKRIRRRAHIMVAEAFIGPRPDGLWVLHRDDDPLNNRVDNLRYGTPTENHADRRRNGHTFEGEGNGAAKLNTQTVLAIRADPRSPTSIAERFGTSRQNVYAILNRVNWRHLPVSGDDAAGHDVIRTLRAQEAGQ